MNRSGTNQAGASIFYRINSYYLSDGPNASQANYQFTLEPGSDYASPGGGKPGGIFSPAPADFSGTNTGTLTWAAKNFDPKPITFTINNDTLTEFNEDFRVDLYDIVNNAVIPVGEVGETTVTIMFDDEDPPAGSVDQFYNPDFGLDMISPVNGPPISTEPRQFPGTDPQSQVNALVIQPDNNTIIGGNFTSYNGTQRHGIARILTNGEIDTSFNPGDGINIVGGDFISAIGLQADGKIVVGGSFTSFNGQSCGNIIRLNADGTLDTGFRSLAGSGANGAVRSLVVRGDGKIIIGGDFTLFNGTSRKYVARLNGDGTVDTTYNPGNALNGPVFTLGPSPSISTTINVVPDPNELQHTNIINVGAFGANSGVLTINYDMLAGNPDSLRVYYGSTVGGVLIFNSGLITGAGQFVIPFGPINGVTASTIEIVMNQGNIFNPPAPDWQFTATAQTYPGEICTVGGDFTQAGGVLGQDHIARLLQNGTLDGSFDPGSGANARVRSIAVQNDGKAIVGGDFHECNGQVATHIARMNVDGTLDTGFFVGTGTDGGVYHLNYVPGLTPDADQIYVGGPFTVYNGTHRLGLARLNNDGSVGHQLPGYGVQRICRIAAQIFR